MVQILFSSCGGARTDRRAERALSGEAADEDLREEDEVDALSCEAADLLLQNVEGLLRVVECLNLGGGELQFPSHGGLKQRCVSWCVDHLYLGVNSTVSPDTRQVERACACLCRRHLKLYLSGKSPDRQLLCR